MTAGPRIRFTATQCQRLRELGAGPETVECVFGTAAERDAHFKATENDLTTTGRRRLAEVRAGERAPLILVLEQELRQALMAAGFVQVLTPVIVGRDSLEKMGIDQAHPLRQQIFWLEDGRLLRPMLAPNLYTLLRRLGRIWSRPFGIFEIGPCFRRDSQGSRHLNEFTMLNLVELGLPEETCAARLSELAALVMAAAHIKDYELSRTHSEVYGEMVDVEVGGTEVCSAASGPHPLDGEWGITEPWVGLGFGLERLVAARQGYANIERAGRSLSYFDGVRLNI